MRLIRLRDKLQSHSRQNQTHTGELNPSLSTIHQSIDLAGQQIAQGLSRLISGDRTATAIALPTQLKVRASSGLDARIHV
ncbi:hypothetical protein MCEMSEM47_00702 [Burkholderiales bacterium]